MTIDELREKREQQQAALTAFVAQANRQVAAMEGAVAMLEQLIGELEAEMEATSEDQDDSGGSAE